MNKTFNLRLDSQIMSRTDLDLYEKLILQYVKTYESKKMNCFVMANTMAELFGLSRGEVMDYLKQMVQNGVLKNRQASNVQILSSLNQPTEESSYDIFEL